MFDEEKYTDCDKCPYDCECKMSSIKKKRGRPSNKRPAFSCKCKQAQCKCGECSGCCECSKKKKRKVNANFSKGRCTKSQESRNRNSSRNSSTNQHSKGIAAAVRTSQQSSQSTPRDLSQIRSTRSSSGDRREITPTNRSSQPQTPTTIASRVLIGHTRGKLNTPETQTLAAEVLKNKNPGLLYAMMDKTPPNNKDPSRRTSLETSDGTSMQTFGDVVQFFGEDVDIISKHFGSVNNRANNVNFPTRYKREFNSLSSFIWKCTSDIAKVAIPAGATKLLNSVIAKGSRDLKHDANENTEHENIVSTKLRELYDKATRRSIERRTIGAAIMHLKPEIGVKMPKDTTKQRNEDLLRILDKGSIQKNTVRREKKSKDVVQSAVEFILSQDNVQILSWGNRSVRLSQTDSVELPKVIRRKLLSQIWSEYNQIQVSIEDRKSMLKRTTFLELATKITFSDQKSITCVDYVEGNLCNDPTEKLQDIIDLFFTGSEKDDLSKWLHISRNFLKVQFDSHVKLCDGDGFHSIGHALARQNATTKKCKMNECDICRSLPMVQRGDASGANNQIKYSIGQRLLYKMNKSSREVLIDVMGVNSRGPHVDAYKVKFVDSELNNEHDVYLHQLREIPCVKVQCNACKFPFWFCDMLKSRITSNLSIPASELARRVSENASATVRELATNDESDSDIDTASELARRVSENASATARQLATNDESDSDIDTANESSRRVSKNASVTVRDNAMEDDISESNPASNPTNDESDEARTNHHLPPLPDVIEAIDNCREKYFYFMRHRMRVICQRDACDKILEILKRDCEQTKRTSRAFIIIDWKMKFEPMSSRETMPENFGKRGLPWHGVAIIYYIWDNETSQAIKQVLYIDQIVDKCSKQDCLSVVALFETTIAAIMTNVPAIKEAIVCSDNAGCYTSKLLVLLVCILNAKYRSLFFISRMLHSETQDGKGPVDRHFAVEMRHIAKYMSNAKVNRIVRINSSCGLAYALQWNNGVRNSIVQLVELDRKRIEAFATTLNKICNQMKKYCSRVNDIEFEFPSEEAHAIILANDVIDPSQFFSSGMALISKIKVRSHSAAGHEIGFILDFGKQKVIPDDSGTLEYNLILGMIQDSVDGDDEDSEEDDDYNDDLSDVNDDLDDDTSLTSAYDDCSPDQSDKAWEEPEQDFEFGDEDDSDSDLANSDSNLDDIANETVLDEIDEMDLEMQSAAIVQEDRLYSKPTEEVFKVDNMLTGVHVVRTSYLVRNSNVKKRSKAKERKKTLSTIEQNIEQRKDAIAVGVRHASDYISGDNNGRILFARETMDVFEKAAEFELRANELPVAGFARRDNGGGNLFGARHVDPFKKLIKEMFEKGNQDKGYKSSAAQVLEQIINDNPGKLAVPTWYEIQCYINQLLQGKKADEEDDIDVADAENEVIDSLGDAFDLFTKRWLRERLYGDIGAKPESLYEEMIVQFPGLLQYEKSSVKKKIGSMKASLKNTAWKSII